MLKRANENIVQSVDSKKLKRESVETVESPVCSDNELSKYCFCLLMKYCV